MCAIRSRHLSSSHSEAVALMQLDNELPKSRKHVWVALLVVAALVAILYVCDLKLTEYLEAHKDGALGLHGPIIRSVLENMMAGATAAFVLAVGYRWIIQTVDPADRVMEVSPERISERLRGNARRTARYTFIGNTATFVSATILPILCSRAQKTGQTIAVKMYIIDPRDVGVIDAYLRHKDRVRLARSRIADSELAAWTRPISDEPAETVSQAKAKLFSCLYLCAYAAKSSGIAIDVYLRKSFTPFRADISDREAILTQESASESAVAFSARGHFYGWYHKEAEALEQQCAEIRLSSDKELSEVVLAHPSESRQAVQESFQKLIYSVLGGYKFDLDAEVEKIAINRIIRPTHSYQS